MTRVPLLDFYRHGCVSQDKEQEIRDTLEECYRRLSVQPLPEKVEVRLCQTPSQLADFLQAEKGELGIQTVGDESFICSHDAWRGFPRVLVCVARLFALCAIARLGTLRHEAAHTVLHGGLAYYVFRIPRDCLELAKAKDMDSIMLQQVLYYCATAVKDFEVTRLLLSLGYRECQAAFGAAQFSASHEDKLAWLLARHHPQGKLLFFTSQLKTLLMGWPLELAGLMPLEDAADSMLNYLEPEERKRLLGMAVSIAKQLGDDTHNNVRLTLGQVLQELI
ncbi:MAG: hypothetical protein HXY36_00510 [Chloroflexi bacterium]|nr:hypothetical protein [Chloroflexota bacterium]